LFAFAEAELPQDITPLERAYLATQAIVRQTPSDNDTLWTCDAVSRLNAYMIQRVRLGELGAARDILERSGESVEEMARQYTQRLDDIRREALRQQPQNPPDIAP
jgi:hypothetical protein